MFCKLVTVLVLFLVFVDISRSSEVHQPVHEHTLINGDVLNKKLLPDVKHLLKGNSDGSRQRFLRLLSGLEVDGYKVVSGKEKFEFFGSLSGSFVALWSYKISTQIIPRNSPYTFTNSHDRDSPSDLPLLFILRSPHFAFLTHSSA